MGFREVLMHSIVPLAVAVKWRKVLNEHDDTGVDLTELSKEFCIDHNLLIAKLNDCGFEKQSINFIYSYLA